MNRDDLIELLQRMSPHKRRMRKQKHFKSERAIMAEIYKVQRKQNALLKLAEEHDLKASALAQESLVRALNEDEVNQLGWERKQAQKARESAGRLDSKVSQLRRTQDAFSTETLPGIVSGGDVVLQK